MKAFKLTSASAAVTAALALGATAGLAMPAAVNAAPLTIDGKPCGVYQKAEFNSTGALILTGVTGATGCKLGDDEGTPGGGDGDGDGEGTPGGGDGDGDGEGTPGGGDGDGEGTPGGDGIPSYCQNQNPAINYTINGYVSAPRQLVTLAGINDYIVKMIPGEGRGYGMADSYAAVGMQNTRTLAISECPGDFTEHLPQPVCAAQAEQFISLKWSYDSARPRGQTQCRLEEGKTYYFNVRNATRSDLDKASCTASTCSSYFTTTASPL